MRSGRCDLVADALAECLATVIRPSGGIEVREANVWVVGVRNWAPFRWLMETTEQDRHFLVGHVAATHTVVLAGSVTPSPVGSETVCSVWEGASGWGEAR